MFFPECLKQTKVFLVLKSGDKLKPSNEFCVWCKLGVFIQEIRSTKRVYYQAFYVITFIFQSGFLYIIILKMSYLASLLQRFWCKLGVFSPGMDYHRHPKAQVGLSNRFKRPYMSMILYFKYMQC